MVIVRIPNSIHISACPDLGKYTYTGLACGVSRLLGGSALCMYGAPLGLVYVPYSEPKRSIWKPTEKVMVPSIGELSVLSWNPAWGGKLYDPAVELYHLAKN
jgi:hypothetical protein